MMYETGWHKMTAPDLGLSTVVWIENDFIYTTEYGCPVQEMLTMDYRFQPVIVLTKEEYQEEIEKCQQR